MSKWKTEEQIAAEVSALEAVKPKLREFTAFGDNNHAAVDAQLAVLRQRMDHDDVYDAYGDEESEDFDQYTLDAALNAHDWMVGTLAADEGSPSEDWVVP
jgi:hypothetical protein